MRVYPTMCILDSYYQLDPGESTSLCGTLLEICEAKTCGNWIKNSIIKSGRRFGRASSFLLWLGYPAMRCAARRAGALVKGSFGNSTRRRSWVSQPGSL